MPSLQQLRYLVSLADQQHFRRAAEACNVTQPTLSAQIKDLETRLGVQLVERARAQVLLTRAGQKIVEKSRTVLGEVEEIRVIARADHDPFSALIRVGVVQSLGPYFLPLVIPDLSRDHPKLTFHVDEGHPEALLADLERGALDLLFFPLPVSRAELALQPLFREPIHVVVARDHPLSKHASIAPEMLRGETILALEPGHQLDQPARRISQDHGAKVSPEYEGTSLDTLRQMVAAGVGVSLMPALYIRSEVARQERVAARPFAGPGPSRTIGMIWRRGTAREAEFNQLGHLIRRALRPVSGEITLLT